MSRFSRAVAAGVVLAVALAACSSAGSLSASAGGANQRPAAQKPFTQATVDAFVADLANAGVPVYPTGSVKPLVPVAAPGPFALSQDQASSAALGAWAHSGPTGAAVDDLAQMVPLTDGAEPIPSALFIEAWSQVAPGPRAALAKKILGDQDWSHYEQVVFPAAVLALFAADIAMTGTGQAAAPSAAATSAGAQPAALIRAAGASSQVVAQGGTSVCEEFKGFVTNTIDNVFKLIGRIELVGYNGNVLHDIFAFIRNQVADVVNLALDAARFVIVNGVQLAFGPVLRAIGAVASVLAVASHIINILQPWDASTQTDPAVLGRSTSANPGKLTLTLRGITDDDDWPDEIKGCARVAGVDLPSLKPHDGDLTWTLAAQSPESLITKTGDDEHLDNVGIATMDYASIPEPAEIQSGEVHNGTVRVDIKIHRKDLDQLQQLVSDQIYGFVPAAVMKIFGSAIRAIVEPQIQRLLTPLTTLRDQAVNTDLTVTYHDQTTATPKPATTAPPKARTVQLPTDCPDVGAVSAAVGFGLTFDPGLGGSILHADPDTLCIYDDGGTGVLVGFGPLAGRDPATVSKAMGDDIGAKKIDIPGTDAAYVAGSSDFSKVELIAGGRWFGLGGPPGTDYVAAVKRLLEIG